MEKEMKIIAPEGSVVERVKIIDSNVAVITLIRRSGNCRNHGRSSVKHIRFLLLLQKQRQILTLFKLTMSLITTESLTRCTNSQVTMPPPRLSSRYLSSYCYATATMAIGCRTGMIPHQNTL